MLLGLAGGLDSPLDQPRCPLPTIRDQPVQLGVDLAGALGEAVHQVLGHALEFAVAVAVSCCPLHPKCPDELALVGGPVDGVRRQPMPVQVAAVQGCPAAVRSFDPVGDDQVGVQQRVTFSGRPMVEADRQHSLAIHVLDTAVAAAGPQVLVQVADRLGDAGMVRGQDTPAGRRVTQAVQDRHALGRPQDQVEGRDAVAAVGAAEQLPGRGVAALEHGLEPGQRCFALQPQAGGPGAIPAAWGLAVAGQILLVIGGQLTGVVLLPPHRELGDVGHHPAAPLPPSLAPATHRWCIALLGKWFGVRVGRKQACDRRSRGVRGCGYFLVRSDRQLCEGGVWRERWTADRSRQGRRTQERGD
jgi:hypothetical protein